METAPVLNKRILLNLKKPWRLLFWLWEWLNFLSGLLRYSARFFFKPPSEIIIIRFSGLGDVLLTTSLLKAFRKKYPRASIYYFTSQQAAVFLRESPFLNKVYTEADIKTVQNLHYDLAVNLQIFDNSPIVRELIRGLDCRLVLGRNFNILGRYSYIPEDVYIKGWVKKFFRISLLPYKCQDAACNELYFSFRPCSFSEIPADYLGLTLPATKKGLNYIRDYSLVYLLGLADFLSDKGYNVVLMGQTSVLSLEDKSIFDSYSFINIKNLTDKLSLEEFIYCIGKARCLITVNSLAMHIRLAFKKPLVILSGGIDSKEYLNYKHTNIYRVLEGDYGCVPCDWRPGPECQKKKKALCIESITYQDVLAAVAGFNTA